MFRAGSDSRRVRSSMPSNDEVSDILNASIHPLLDHTLGGGRITELICPVSVDSFCTLDEVLKIQKIIEVDYFDNI